MNKIIYTNDDGIISIVIPAPKEQIETILGPLTEDQYVSHVIERSIPKGKRWRYIEDSDIPSSRKLRNAWVDVTENSKVDICCERARDIRMGHLRKKRNEELEQSDISMVRALEDNDAASVSALKKHRRKLRSITEGMKALTVVGRYNDASLLEEIDTLSKQLD